MGRRRLEIKRIEDNNRRQVAFSKRRNGLMKKAKDLSVLCDVDVAVIVFSNRGKLYEISTNNSLSQMVQRHQEYKECKGNSSQRVHNTELEKQQPVSLSIIKQLLETVDRGVEDPNVEPTHLLQLEKQLETALMETRSRKMHLTMDFLTSMKQMEKSLSEENELLQNKMSAIENTGMAVDITLCNQMMTGQQRTLNLLHD